MLTRCDTGSQERCIVPLATAISNSTLRHDLRVGHFAVARKHAATGPVRQVLQASNRSSVREQARIQVFALTLKATTTFSSLFCSPTPAEEKISMWKFTVAIGNYTHVPRNAQAACLCSKADMAFQAVSHPLSIEQLTAGLYAALY